VLLNALVSVAHDSLCSFLIEMAGAMITFEMAIFSSQFRGIISYLLESMLNCIPLTAFPFFVLF
jgi:hypothetical protein